MVGDNLHTALLQDDWKWDGVSYGRTFSLNGGYLHLRPSNPDSGDLPIAEMRKKHWDLRVGQARVCSYKTFMDAARAVLGNA